MKNRAKSSKLANEWFEKGNHDLEDAQRLFRNGGYTDTICFHCQQAVEKYLKGFLVLNKKVPRKVHDLVVLLEDCFKLNKEFKKILSDCKRLNRYYIETRYPAGMPILYSKQETKESLTAAEKILTFVTEQSQS